MRNGNKVLVAGAGLLGTLAVLTAGCGGKGGTGTGGAGGGEGAPTCTEYCDRVTANCTGDVAVYASKEVCLDACKYFPVGTAADTTGNTLGCRIYHAGAAAGSAANATLHCPHAGPGGAGYCGSNCLGYCNLAQGVCMTYATEKDCEDVCKGFKDQEPFTAMDTTGNTVQCRLYHASVAAGDPKTHCPHIGVTPPAGTCTDP